MLRRRLRDASSGKRRDEPEPVPKPDELKGIPKGGGGAAYRAQMERQRLRQIENPRPRGDAWGVYESAHPRGDDARKRVSDVLAGAKTSPKDAGAPRAILKREGYTSSVFLPPTAHPSGADVERTASPGRRYRAMPVLLSRVTSPSQGPPVEDTSILCDVSAGESSPDKADDDSPTGVMTYSSGRFPNTPVVAPPSGSGRSAHADAPYGSGGPSAHADAPSSPSEFTGFRSTYVRPSPSPGGSGRTRSFGESRPDSIDRSPESHTEFYARVTGKPFPTSPGLGLSDSPTPAVASHTPAVASPSPISVPNSGPSPSAFLFDGSPEARDSDATSTPGVEEYDFTKTPAPAPMRISAAVRLEPVHEVERMEPVATSVSPVKRQPEFLPKRRHPRFEPSKQPGDISMSLVDRIRSDGDEGMAREFMETVPTYSPATSTRFAPGSSQNRSERRVTFEQTSVSRMRDLGGSTADPLRFTHPSPARYGCAAARAAKAKALSEKAAAKRKSALAKTVLVDARRLRRLEARSPRLRYVAATRGDGLREGDEALDASFDSVMSGDTPFPHDRRIREIAAVISALDESASPGSVDEAARMMADAAAKAAVAEAERKALMEDKHARKAISRMTRHRLRTWRQVAATARLVRACASKWRVKARRCADLDRKKLSVATKALFGWTHRKFETSFVHWRDLCAQKAGARVMADLAYSGKCQEIAVLALREWRDAAAEITANRWRETRLKKCMVKQWSDVAAAQRHDGYRAVKAAMLTWRTALHRKERLEELVRTHRADVADDVASRVLNCWASLRKRDEFRDAVLAPMLRMVRRNAWIQRIADAQRRKRLIERWSLIVRDANLRALGHWARRLAARLLAEWAALALAGRRNRERAFTARALRGVVQHQRAVDLARANGLEGVPLTPSPLARARRRRSAATDVEDVENKDAGVKTFEDLQRPSKTPKAEAPAGKDATTSPEDDAESHARWERRGAEEAPPGSSRLARHSTALSDVTDVITSLGAEANTPGKLARSIGASAMKTRRRKVLVPVRTPGSGRTLGSRGGRRRESAPALRVYWDIAEGAARVDADGDSADYELSSSGSEDATQAPEPILDLSPDVASKPPDGSVNPLGTPEPLPEFEALPEEVREALSSPQDPEETTTPIAPRALRDDTTQLVGFYSPEEGSSPMDRLVNLARNTPMKTQTKNDGSSSPVFEFRGEVERIDKVLRDLYSNRR